VSLVITSSRYTLIMQRAFGSLRSRAGALIPETGFTPLCWTGSGTDENSLDYTVRIYRPVPLHPSLRTPMGNQP
jgi:hypothetical protein